ncbi:MAG: sigma-70 family RNA polymerase sigma factor [Gemmatimonadaceae bacterium]
MSEREAPLLSGLRRTPANHALAPDEARVVRRVRGGDESACEWLYREYHERLWRFAYTLVHSSAVAEELVHDVFLAVWRDRASWNVNRSPRLWLYGAVRNRAMNHLRHERVVAEVALREPVIAMGAAPIDPQSEVEAHELDERVSRALSGVSERRRIAMTLRWRHDFTLAPGSQLRVAADFGVDRRSVYLDGLAYFDVLHDARRPFTVLAGNARALDLGTQFVVRAYAEDSAVQVGVRTGNVMLSGVGQLRAGDVGQLQSNGRTRRWRGALNDPLLAWLDNRLVYRDAPLSHVLQDIHRWYDVEVRVAQPAIAALPFSGVLTEQSSGAVIDRVAATLGLRVRRDCIGVVLER